MTNSIVRIMNSIWISEVIRKVQERKQQFAPDRLYVHWNEIPLYVSKRVRKF